jgi:fibronectin-binding autotransporter adhesin
VVQLRISALLFVTLFALTSCGGGGGSSLLGGGSLGGGSTSGSGTTGATNSNQKVQMNFSYASPSASSSSSARASASSSARAIVSSTVRKPKTISSDTSSITVSVNGGTPQIFNAAPPTCVDNGTTVTCSLSIGAPVGLDSFLIITYSGSNGTGTALNAAAVTLSVSTSGPNTAAATAGNVLFVNSSADGSGGSYSCASSTSTCTLREAVAEASTTAGVFTAILFQGVTTINLISSNGPIVVSGQSLIVLGPGASAANPSGVGAPSASSGLTISGGNATQIFSITSGSLLVDGITLSGGNSSDNSGGAIENYSALSVVNTIFSGNGGGTTDYGGAIYDDGGTPSTIVASTFTNNTAIYNGGAYYDEGSASFNHVLFSANTAFDGSSEGYGGAIYADWDIAVTNSTFTGNVAGSTTVSNVSGYGGGIYINDNSMSPTITNSTFGTTSLAGNFAGGPGASAYGEGGAIYNDGSYPVTLSGNSFTSNTAKGGSDASGGAVSDYEGVSSTNDTFANNLADASAAMAGCEMYAYGGAAYTENYNYVGTTWTNDSFSGNTALGTLTGDAYAYGGALFDYYGGGINVTGSTFTNNTANGGVYIGSGGGLAVQDDEGPATLTNLQFTGNTATAQSGTVYGGGLAVYYADVAVSGLTFNNNSATITGSATGNYAYGGGFEFYDGDEESESVARKANPAMIAKRTKDATKQQKHAARVLAHTQAGNVAHIFSKSKHALAIASRHSAPSASRKVQVSTPPSTIANVTFSGNTANGGPSGYSYGGGADLSGYPTITGTSFTNNTATYSGTGGYAAGGGFSNGSDYCGEMTFTGTVSGNSATNAGGGIWNDCNTFTLLQSTIANNTVTAVQYTADGGGGVWSDCGSVAITQTTISGNSVAGAVAHSGGGGVLNQSGDLTISNSTITANTSASDGGGVENLYSADVELLNATVYKNTATGNGGGVSNDDGGDGSPYLYIENSILAGNTTSANGTDIWNLDTVYSYGYNLVQQSSNYGSGTSNAPQTGDIIGQSPALASGLASNGGPTQTIADTSSSPGKGVIPFNGVNCGSDGPAVDQRNYTRGAGSVCDIGAYEFSGTQSTTQSKARSAPRANFRH